MTGRLAEKLFLEGMRTKWLYDGRGQLRELVHEDDRGVLDRYQYEYDLMGNKTAITKERRGLKEESGRYEYGYDGRGNLIREETEGKLLHGYEYGAMNRLSKSWNDKGGESLYLYNGLGQRMGRSINGREEDYLLVLAPMIKCKKTPKKKCKFMAERKKKR